MYNTAIMEDAETQKKNVKLYQDFFQSICEQISDPKTFFNFALANEVTRRICALLKKRKRLEFFPPKLYIPLKFWFNRNPNLALPLVALNNHQVDINFDFRPLIMQQPHHFAREPRTTPPIPYTSSIHVRTVRRRKKGNRKTRRKR